MKDLINIRETGHHLKMLCEQNNVTAALIQNIFQFKSPQTIYRWFRGETLPSVEYLLILAELFNQPLEELLILNNSAAEEKMIANMIRWAGEKAKDSSVLQEAIYDALADLIIRK